MVLRRLKAVKDIETLDAELNKIDSYLEDFQCLYKDYILYAAAKGKKVERQVRTSLCDVVSGFEEARKQLLGLFSHWVNC